MRKRVQPVFRERSIARLSGVIVRGVDAMVDRWQAAEEIDLADEMAALSLQHDGVGDVRVESGAELAAIERGLVNRTDVMSRTFNSLVDLPGFLPLTLSPRRRRAIGDLDRRLDLMIREHRQRGGGAEDLLAMVMATHNGADGATELQRVRGEALTLVLAAYENVARTLTWTLLGLARHDDVQAELRGEVRRAAGRLDADGGLPRAALHGHGRGRVDAAVAAEPVRVPHRPRRRRPPHRHDHPRRIEAADLALHRPARPAQLPRPRALRSPPVRPGGATGTTAVRLLPIRRRPAGVHRADPDDASVPAGCSPASPSASGSSLPTAHRPTPAAACRRDSVQRCGCADRNLLFGPR